MSAGMIIYFVALGVLDIAFLVGLIYVIKCHDSDPKDKGTTDGSGSFLFICGVGFIITAIVIAASGYKLAN